MQNECTCCYTEKGMTKREATRALWKLGGGRGFGSNESTKNVWATSNSIPSIIIPTYLPQNHFYNLHIIPAKRKCVDGSKENVLLSLIQKYIKIYSSKIFVVLHICDSFSGKALLYWEPQRIAARGHTDMKETPRRGITVTSSLHEISFDHLGKRVVMSGGCSFGTGCRPLPPSSTRSEGR
jgi:hypothetical protein